MSDCPSHEKLLAFQSHSLEAGEQEVVRAHLERCVSCNAALGPTTIDGLTPRSLATALGEAPEQPLRRIDDYVLIDKLGEGGMGSVYLAYHPQLDRNVAIKTIKWSRSQVSEPERAKARLLREAQAMARLDHPNVVAVHDVGTFNDLVYLVMDRVNGTTLNVWLLRHPKDWRLVVDTFVQAGRGLEAAHRVGLIHRDFKPANVLVGQDGRPRVTDFGVARLEGLEKTRTPEASFSSAEKARAHAESSAATDSLTHPGSVLGTPAYMAPELFVDALATVRTDQFSFCVALYEALYGQRPFDPSASLEKRYATAPQPPRGIKEPQFIRQAVLRGLSKDPAARFETMGELLAQLERKPLTARAVAPWAALVLVALSASLFVWAATRQEPLPTCSASERALDTWHDGRRAAVQRALRASELSSAAKMADNAIAQLDENVAQWRSEHEARCNEPLGSAAHNAPVLRQLECLSSQRQQFDAVTETLSQLESEQLFTAPAAIASLMSPERCRDANTLAVAPKWPENAKLREQVQYLRFQAELAKAANAIGRHDRALGIEALISADPAFEQFKPLQAEVLSIRVRARMIAGDFEQCWQEALAATPLAELTGQDQLAARSEADAAFCGAYSKHREAAAWHLDHAKTLLERTNGDLGTEGAIANSASLLASLDGDQALSLSEMRRALELFERLFGPGHPSTLVFRSNLGVALGEACRHADGAELLSTFNVPKEAEKYPIHYSRGLTHLASAQLTLHRFDDAARSLALLDSVADSNTPALVSSFVLHSDLARSQGHADEALNWALKARARSAKLSRLRSNVEVAVAESMLALHRAPEAAQVVEHVVAENQGQGTPESVGELLVLQAVTLLESKQPQRAVTALEKIPKMVRLPCRKPEVEAMTQYVRALTMPASQRGEALTLARAARPVLAALPWHSERVARLDTLLTSTH